MHFWHCALRTVTCVLCAVVCAFPICHIHIWLWITFSCVRVSKLWWAKECQQILLNQAMGQSDILSDYRIERVDASGQLHALVLWSQEKNWLPLDGKLVGLQAWSGPTAESHAVSSGLWLILDVSGSPAKTLVMVGHNHSNVAWLSAYFLLWISVNAAS
jgi:hypothetical protein